MIITEQWRKICRKIVKSFVNKYFEKNTEFDFTGEDLSIFNVNDYYFNFYNAVFCLENNVLEEKLFEWYDRSLIGETDLSLDDFLIFPETLKKQQEEYLETLRQRLKTAEKEFNKAMENYGG